MISNISQVMPMPLSPAQPAVPPSSVISGQVVAVQGQDSAVRGKSGSAQSSVSTGEQKVGSDKELVAGVDLLNAKIQNLNRNLVFSINKDSGEVLVKVIDAQTREVVRQIPSEEVLELAHNIDQYMQDHHSGLLKAKA